MTVDASPAISLRDAVALVNDFPLLAGVTLEVPPASLTVVTGANGAGKTSLLRLLGGLVRLSRGAGEVAGVDLATGDLRELRRRVGWLGHEGSFYDDLSARENLVFAARALARPRELIDPALERVG
ncbi:MAG: ATP-binding cassette domain-containing protein, partial [Acidobacteriota bacterium]|nr:ATP-binding cassette domain-containing protein [Acidobacteriota bacterium]